jgi:hypothetical protein
VLRDGGLREIQIVDDFAANAGGSPGQEAQNPHPSRVRQRFAKRRKLRVSLRALHRAEVRPRIVRWDARLDAEISHRSSTIGDGLGIRKSDGASGLDGPEIGETPAQAPIRAAPRATKWTAPGAFIR